MQVKAKSPGYYGNHYKSIGDIFDIEDRLFSSKWMIKLQESPKEERRKPTVVQKIKTSLGGK